MTCVFNISLVAYDVDDSFEAIAWEWGLQMGKHCFSELPISVVFLLFIPSISAFTDVMGCVQCHRFLF